MRELIAQAVEILIEKLVAVEATRFSPLLHKATSTMVVYLA